jgi:DNA-binding LacI/PurR family transcriptional regulator
MHFDGAILAGGSYYHTELADSIADTLGKLGIPAVMLDCVKEGFPSVIQDSREHFCMLTEHFITEHGYDDILSWQEGTKPSSPARNPRRGKRLHQDFFLHFLQG